MSADPLSVSVVGLGKLGVCLAAEFANRGAQVYGVESDPHRALQISQRIHLEDEPGLADALTKAAERLHVVERLEHAVLRSEVTFLVLPTPSNEDGGFSNKYLIPAIASITTAARRKDTSHLAVIVSTVSVGSLRSSLAKAARIDDVGSMTALAYSPLFVALGSVFRDLKDPAFVLVGADEEATRGKLIEIYARLGYAASKIIPMTSVNAELTKVALNSFLTTKIAFANEIGALCDRIEDADADTVLAAVGLDRRVESAGLTAGAPFGGPCFPRDNGALRTAARRAETLSKLPAAVDASNEQWSQALVRIVLDELASGRSRFLVSGLAYRPGTHIAEYSFGARLVTELLSAGADVATTGPEDLAVSGSLGLSGLTKCLAAGEAVAWAEVLVLALPRHELADFVGARPPENPLLIIDVWRAWRERELSRLPNVEYRGIGARARSNE